MAKAKGKKKTEVLDYGAQVRSLREQGPGRLYLLWGREDYLREQYLLELKKLCLHAYAAKKPVKEVAQLRDKYVWTRVDYLLGLTPEKLARAEHEYKVDRIHRLFGLDKKLVDKYMRMRYASHQVKRAMFLARHCDKSVEELLAMKTRQQKWGDICEQLGLPRDACMK